MGSRTFSTRARHSAGIVVALAACWVPGYLAGGADAVPPLWPVAAVVLAGFLFGIRGALASAALATVIAGPLTPANVHNGTPQVLSDWLTRGGFFVALGVMTAVMFARLWRR